MIVINDIIDIYWKGIIKMTGYKRFLTELNVQELDKVLEKNKGLQELIRERTAESESLFVDDQLAYLKKGIGDYSISPYTYSHIAVTNKLEFLYGVRELERSIPILNDKDSHYLETALANSKKLYSKDGNTDENNNNFNHSIIDLRDKVLSNMIEKLEYGDSDEAVKDYFFEMYVSFDSDGVYIDSDDFILKEDITKTYEF